MTDAAFVAGIRRADAGALAQLYEKFAPDVLRVLVRILGPDSELDDIHHDVFVRALSSIRNLRDPEAIRPWLMAITVHAARTALARRQRGRWLRLLSFSALSEAPAPQASGESLRALREVYRLLDQLGTDDRVAFSLRFIEGLELQEVAAACGVSLATAKRRIARAQSRFHRRARGNPELAEWLSQEAPDGRG